MRVLNFKTRIRIIIAIFLLVAVVLLVNLFNLQVINGEAYLKEVNSQHISSSSDVFSRGSIFFSDKDGSLVSAATVTSGFKVSVRPDDLEEDGEDLFEKLSSYLNIDRDTFLIRVNKKGDPYEEIASKLTKEQVDEIETLGIKGLSIHKDNWRSYPSADVASHSIGFLAYQENELKGRYGLERFYDSVLARPQDEPYVNFFAEAFSNIKKGKSDQSRGDVVTTLEPVVAYTFETELSNVVNKWKADQAGGIIINPQNGEIYAMAGFPNFDLNNFRNVSDPDIFRNPLVENVFEMGSVIKPLVMASAIDAGAVTPETSYYDSGSITVDKKVISNFDKKGRGQVTMQDVLNQSLNTGMVFAESKLGHEKFREYVKAFGLGEKTGIDLPNETSGLMKNLLTSPRDIEYANASFGQGIALTPIGAVRSFSALANGGNLITPHLMKEIKYNNGLSEKNDTGFSRQNVLKPETVETITKMLVKVFDNYDSGAHKFEHYSIAAKTGTAQIARESGGGYYDDRNMHSFFGYFPAYEPKFLVFLYIKNPKGIKYASQTLIPSFVNITKFLLNYYNVPPDR
jgi:cell division protein FtsI/penicillin-binding protein 2